MQTPSKKKKKKKRGVEGRGVVPSTGVGVWLGRGVTSAASGAVNFSLTELSKARDLILLPRKDFLHERLQEAHAR